MRRTQSPDSRPRAAGGFPRRRTGPQAKGPIQPPAGPPSPAVLFTQPLYHQTGQREIRPGPKDAIFSWGTVPPAGTGGKWVPSPGPGKETEGGPGCGTEGGPGAKQRTGRDAGQRTGRGVGQRTGRGAGQRAGRVRDRAQVEVHMQPPRAPPQGTPSETVEPGAPSLAQKKTGRPSRLSYDQPAPPLEKAGSTPACPWRKQTRLPTAPGEKQTSAPGGFRMLPTLAFRHRRHVYRAACPRRKNRRPPA